MADSRGAAGPPPRLSVIGLRSVTLPSAVGPGPDPSRTSDRDAGPGRASSVTEAGRSCNQAAWGPGRRGAGQLESKSRVLKKLVVRCGSHALYTFIF